jgi:hypothetical protein
MLEFQKACKLDTTYIFKYLRSPGDGYELCLGVYDKTICINANYIKHSNQDSHASLALYARAYPLRYDGHRTTSLFYLCKWWQEIDKALVNIFDVEW